MYRAMLIAVLAGCSSLLAGCNQASVQPEINVGAGDDWASVGGGADESGYSQLTDINDRNVDKLGLVYSLDLPDETTLQAPPLAIGGTLYFTGTHAAVYAVDAVTGKELWKYDPETWKHDPASLNLFWSANRGLAYENGKIFVGAFDNRLIALDARTGKEIWAVPSAPEGAYYSTGAPRAMNGKIIIGSGGADHGARGFAAAFDANSGKLLWRFFTTPASPDDNRRQTGLEPAARSWGPDFYKHGGGGGTVWNGMTYDADRDRIYIGVGNAGVWNPDVRDPGSKGDNLYTSSIVALDASTGRYLWHFQEVPRDRWDYKATPNIQFVTLTIGGTPRKVLLHAPTNGFFYVLDRDTGRLINTPGKTTEISWAKGIDGKTGRPIGIVDFQKEQGEGVEIWPATIGGHNWQPMAYSPRTGLVYIPIQQIGMRFSRGGSRVPDSAFGDAVRKVEPVIKRPGDGHGFLVAWDPVAQKEAWRVQRPALWNGGTMATAGNLVFQGGGDGVFAAYDAKSGERLWQFNAGLGIVAAPVSYRVKNKQYVSILVGYGGTTAAFGKFMDEGWKYGAQPRRLLTFAFGGTAKLPQTASPDKIVHAQDDPSLVLNEADVDAGRQVYLRCFICHGTALQATGSPAPDLRESAIPLQFDAFKQVVRDGALLQKGMPRFQDLTDADLRHLQAYIRAKARETLGKRRASDGNALGAGT